MRTLLIFVFSLFFFSAAVLAQSDCSESTLKQAASDVRNVQSKLLAVKVADFGMDSSVPPPLRALIRDFKDALTKASDLSLACNRKTGFSPEALQQSLSEMLGATPPAQKTDIPTVVESAENEVDQIYGASLNISVQAPTAFPELRLVKIAFGIDCGDDTLLLLAYDLSKKAPKRVLRWQSGDYEDVSEAFGDYFRYAVVPLKSELGWGLITYHGTPWCTSRWSRFDLDLIAAGTDSLANRHATESSCESA